MVIIIRLMCRVDLLNEMQERIQSFIVETQVLNTVVGFRNDGSTSNKNNIPFAICNRIWNLLQFHFNI